MTGVVLAFVGIVVPIVFVVAQFGKMETADSLGVPLGRGTASIDMTAGHAYDLLTERRGRLNTCVLDGPETTGTVSVRARSSRIEYSVGDRQDPGDDVVRGVWYLAGSFESPMSGNVTVMCEGDAAAGALTLIADDDARDWSLPNSVAEDGAEDGADDEASDQGRREVFQEAVSPAGR